VRRAGERLRITAELTEVADGYQLWSGRYDRNRQDIFAVQEEVAQAISSALKDKLHYRPVIAVPQHSTSTDAYDAFLQGRYYWHQQTQDGVQQSVQFFERAVGLDPEFGKAYAWLAIVRTYWTVLGYVPPAAVIPAARQDANRAIALDPDLPEAHLTLGLIAQYADWDWEATERHYRRAVELSPGNATVRSWFGIFLARQGHGDEAVAQCAAGLDLDPLAHESSWLYLVVLTHLGRHAEAVALGHKAAAVHSRSPHMHWPTGIGHLGLGEPDQALEWIRRALDCEPANPIARALAVRAIAQAGRTAEARQHAEKLLDEKRNGYFSPLLLAVDYLAFDEYNHSIALLKEAIEGHDAMVPNINHWALAPPWPRWPTILATRRYSLQ
jgi:tetratricopeptide (TPR) repeat protein